VSAVAFGAPRPKGRHIPLSAYATCDDRPLSIEAELEALAPLSSLTKRVAVIDCPDCGRTLAIEGRCRKCGGASWMPAGHVDRFELQRLREALRAVVGGGHGE